LVLAWPSDQSGIRDECLKNTRTATGGITMKATNLKRIAATGAITGALSFGALGLGAGVANADDDAGGSGGLGGLSGLSDIGALIPMISQIGNLGDLGGLGGGGLGGLGGGGLDSLVGLLGGLGG
jgi:hypothetical protein